MADTVRRRWTLAEFLAWENQQETRHEFVSGRVRAMVGASRQHNMIARNLLAYLYDRLGNGKCQPYGSNMKVIRPEGNIRYPDVLVDCGPEKPDDVAATEPTVAIEVLSKSTAFFDQTEKLADYQSVPSMQHVLHLVQERAAGELWTRSGDGWRRTPLVGADAEVDLAAIGVTFALSVAYDGVPLDEAEANDP